MTCGSCAQDVGGAIKGIRERTAIRLPDGTAVLEVGPDVWSLEGDVKSGAAGNALGGVVGDGVGAPDGAAVVFFGGGRQRSGGRHPCRRLHWITQHGDRKTL